MRPTRLIGIDWIPLGFALLLSALGLAVVYSACYDPDARWGWGQSAIMQGLWMIIGVAVLLFVLNLKPTLWKHGAFVFYFLGIGTLLFMMVAAGSALVPNVKGQCNWIRLGPISIQPSEFVKISTLLAVARFLSLPGSDPTSPIRTLMALAIGGLPMILLAKEDMGGALTMIPMILGLVIVAGARWKLMTGLGLGAATLGTIGILKLSRDGYMWRRLMAWLHPEQFPLQEGYQPLRALRSIGSGGWFGKGYCRGPQNLLGWLPERHNDMIFAVLAEETGLLGSLVFLTLLIFFGLSLLRTAAMLRNPFCVLVISGTCCLILGQSAINLMVATSIMPTTGVTLPFLSCGGSSIVAIYMALGICLALSSSEAQHDES